MKTLEQLIKEEVKNQSGNFNASDIRRGVSLNRGSATNHHSVSSYLSIMYRNGLIDRVDRGVYKNTSDYNSGYCSTDERDACYLDSDDCVSVKGSAFKLEVGKKYLDELGNEWAVTSENPYSENVIFVAVCENGMIPPDTFWGNGKGVSTDNKSNLVKEYVGPKTKDIWVVWHSYGVELYSFRTDFQKGGALGFKKVTLVEGEYD